MISCRSALFTPAHDERRVAKAAGYGADLVILDLEDAVPTVDKPTARLRLPGGAASLAEQGQAVAVRINHDPQEALQDLAAATAAGVCTIVVPKVINVASLARVTKMWEEIAGASKAKAELVALVESPQALRSLDEIAAHPWVAAVALGPEDYATHFRCPPSAALLRLPCGLIAAAAASHGRQCLAAPASISDYGNEDAFSRALVEAGEMGATGALCIHPVQVACANRRYVTSPEDLERAVRISEEWERRSGEGAFAFEGRMIDAPVARRARRLIASQS